MIEAIASGKKAAEMIDRYLRGLELKVVEEKIGPIIRLTEEEIAKIERKPRQEMPKLPLEARRGNFDEVELGFDEEAAIEEAKRCLRCWTRVASGSS